MEKITLRPRFLRTIVSSVSVFTVSILISVLYLWMTGDKTLFEYLDVSLFIPIIGHLIGTAANYKGHVETFSITLSNEGVEGPETKLFSKAQRKFLKFGDIEKVTNVGRPRWLFTPRIISRNGLKIAIDWGITNEDYRLILTTLENHYVKVSDYVWQIYPDR